MTTLAADVRPAKITRTTTHDNDNIACWTSDPRAALLLASCAAQPPAGTFHRQTYGFATDRWFAYVGYRVEALTAIRDEIGARMLAYYHEHGDAGYEPFRQYCRQPSVTDAIDAATSAANTAAAPEIVSYRATIDTGHGETIRDFQALKGEEMARLCEIDCEARMAFGRRSIVISASNAEG